MKKINFSLFVALSALLLGCETNNYFNPQSLATQMPTTTVSTDAGSTVAPDSAPAAASDTGTTPTIVPDSGTAMDVEIVVDTGRTIAGCLVSDPIFIGHGNGSVTAGSSKGFGIVWNSNYRSATQTDTMFQAIDPHGADLAAVETVNITDGAIGPRLDIAAMSNLYVIDAFQADYTDNFWFCNFDGSGAASNLDQPHGYLPIVNSDGEYFGFWNDDSPSAMLQMLQLGFSLSTIERTVGWNPGQQGTTYPTKGVKFDGSSWAFAFTVGSVTEVAVVIADGVNMTTITNTANTGGIVAIGDITAVDDGYALHWNWFSSDYSSRRSFISFIPQKGTTDGMEHNTVEISALAPGIQMVEYIAWNGNNLGYLAVNANPNPEDPSQQVGRFFLLDKLGTVMKTATVASPFKLNTTGQTVSFASSGSSFGVTVSSSSDQIVRFQAVTCQ